MKKKSIEQDPIIADLNTIKNVAFCSYTLPRARRLLNKIKPQLAENDYIKLKNYIDNIDVDNPDVYVVTWARSGGYKRHLMHIRAEFALYVDSLIRERIMRIQNA